MFEVPEVCPVDDGTDWVQVAEFGPTTPAVIVTVIWSVAEAPEASEATVQVTVPAVFVGVQAPAGVTWPRRRRPRRAARRTARRPWPRWRSPSCAP